MAKGSKETSNEKSDKKKLNRYLTSIVGLPIVIAVFIFANVIAMDIILAVLGILMMYEYLHCFKSTGKANPTSWISFLLVACVAGIHLIPENIRYQVLFWILPIVMLILFVEVIISKGKKNAIDVAVTMFGLIYIPFNLVFISLLRGTTPELIGKIYAGLLFTTSWGSDGPAYIFGMKFGKHKLTPISPKKSVEGAVAGLLGSVAFSLLFVLLMNIIFNLTIGYVQILIISIILGIIGQVGDIAASSIKRYCGIKDFSQLLPGHGGLLDRIDSLIFIAPFAYMLLTMI